MPKILGREPALWAGLANAAIYLVGAFLVSLSDDQESMLIAVVAALLGLVVAAMTHDGLSAAILGFAKAGVALALGFGLKLSAEQQAVILSFAAAAVAMFVRTQATAPVTPRPVPPPADMGTR
jgi:hypothetical protein